MRVKLAEVVSELPLRYAAPFVAVVYAVGLYGFYQVCPAESACGAGGEPFTFLNNALRTFGLFFSLAEPGHEALRNVWLMAARWIAPCITLFAIFRLFAIRFAVWRKQISLGRLNDHHLLVGFGESARHLNSTAQPIVIVDRLAEVFSGAAPVKSKFNITGDGRELKVLTEARVSHAKSLLIMGGTDSENLDIVAQVSKLRSAGKNKLRVAVRLKSQSLVAQLNREDNFVAMDNLDVTAFTLDQIAAQVFLTENSLSESAHLRGLARVHLVIVGWSDFALCTILQFLRISPYATLGSARISIVAANASEVLKNIQRQHTALADERIVLLKAYDTFDLPQQKQLSEIEKLDSVSAILIAHDDDEKNSVAALTLRQITQIESRWLAPIFVRLKSSSALEAMLRGKMGRNIDPAQEIISVGQTAKCLNFENIFGQRDALAKNLHDAYRKGISTPSAATQDWGKLPATYRIANSAAADHSTARILSSGYVVTQGSAVPNGAWKISEPSADMETLAALTHRAWEIDRRLDGWRFGKTRDNQKLIHPSIRPYDDLSDHVKDFDRAQIRLLAKVLQQSEGPATVFKDCVVAALGHNALLAGEAEEIRAATKLAMTLLNAEHVTLVSPLAPGSDSMIVDAALDVLIVRKIPFRFFVLQALPWKVVRDEYFKTHGGDVDLLDQARATILTKAAAVTQIVHLETLGVSDEAWAQKPDLRIAAYRKANQWMVERAHHALCHLRDEKKILPGGTAEAFSHFKKTKAKIHRV